MSDRDRLAEVWRQRRWGQLAMIIGANVVMAAAIVGAFVGIALLVLLAGIYALDWLGTLPCLCV